MRIIRSETPGRRLASAKNLAKSLPESLTKSVDKTLSETLGETFGETLGETFRARQASPKVSDRIICMALRKTLSETRFLRG